MYLRIKKNNSKVRGKRLIWIETLPNVPELCNQYNTTVPLVAGIGLAVNST